MAVTELGSALKFETEEPHFVSLGGGRLSIGVTLCPINKGKYETTIFVTRWDMDNAGYPLGRGKE